LTNYKIKQIFKNQLIGLLFIVIGICVILSFLSEWFFNENNFKNIAQQITIFGLLGIGMTFVILTGGIDLSVGSTLAFSSVILGIAMKGWGYPLGWALVLCILIGCACGAINGLLVTVANVPPFIATMGTLGIFRGLALTVTFGSAVTGFGKNMRFIGAGTIGGVIPFPFFLFVLILFISYFVLDHTKTGRSIYVLGGNVEAARLSGIRVRAIKFLTYVICGATAAIASMVMVGRLNSAQPIAADGYELDAIAAVVLGGTSMNGGAGSIWGTLLGALTMTIMRNGMNLLNVHTYWQKIINGIIIIVAVMFDTLRDKDKRIS
jgi:ribose/xylose/arabinose/galactoside ABC-type transport system permease subunit